MKWIKTRNQFLNEAKLRDVLLKRQAKEVSQKWGEKFLDYEEIQASENIIQGKWKLDESDKLKALSAFFDCDMEDVMNMFSGLSDKFNTIISESINLDLLNDEQKVVMDNFNIQSPTVDQIVFLFENVFRKLSITETQASEMIQKDERGRPVRDEEGNMLKVQKNPGDPIFTNNLVNINTFTDDFNRCYQAEAVKNEFLSNRNISQLRNLAKDNQNADYKYEYQIFGKDMYLEINHNPKDILNMSISKFYSSCQHLYTGGYRKQLLGNVFDPNSIPAFLVFNTAITWNNEVISDKLPLSRMIIRNIESPDGNDQIFFDRAYPDRMKNVFDELVTKYSKNKQTADLDDLPKYTYSPDVDFSEDELDRPYMDRLGMSISKRIGVNTKKLYLNSSFDWSGVRISPKNNLEEVIIETTDVPENFFDLKLNLNWIKFKYLDIKTIKNFEKIKTESIAFDKCKFDSSIISQLLEFNADIKRISISSCDLTGDLEFDKFKKLEELQLIYTLDSPEDLIKFVSGCNLKKLVISGDISNQKSAKEFITELKKSGCKVQITGPEI